MGPTTKSRLLLASSALLLAAVAGCGTSASNDVQAPALSGAPSAVPSAAGVDAGTPAPTPKPKPAIHGLDRAQLIEAMKSAFERKPSAHMHMVMSGSSAQMTATGDVRYGATGPEMKMRMQLPSVGAQNAEVRFVGGIMYIAVPPMTPAGKFVKVDPNAANSPFGNSLNGLSDAMNPKSTFATFDRGLKKSRYLGVESVNGEDMGHYVLTVSTAAAGGGPVPGAPRRVTYDLWLDRDNLMRKLQMSVSGVGLDMDISRWGEPVHVTAPPSVDIITPPGG